MPVAQPGILCGPESSATVWLAPDLKPGASLTWLAVTFTIAIISEHWFGLPLSQTVYSKLACPLKAVAGVKVMSPLVPRETWPLTAWSTAVTVRVWLLSLAGAGASFPKNPAGGKTQGGFSFVDFV